MLSQGVGWDFLSLGDLLECQGVSALIQFRADGQEVQKGVIQRNAKFLRLSKPLSVLNGPEPCWILICCTKRWPVSTISNSSVTRYSYQLQSRESAPSDCICCFPSNLLRCGISWRRLPWVFLAPSAGSSPYQTDVCSCKWFLQIQCRSTRRVQLRSHLHGRL